MPSIDYGRAADLTAALEERLATRLRRDGVSRRAVLGGVGMAGAAVVAGVGGASTDGTAGGATGHDDEHGNFGANGEFDPGFDPHEFLRTFNTGRDGQDAVSQEVYTETDAEGNERTVRRFEFSAVDTTIEVAPGVEFTAWAYNGQVPGPTLRAVEGDVIEVHFENFGEHAHTIHPHLRNPRPEMDGIPQNGPGVIDRTDEPFTYRWPAEPVGVHLYHCHSLPLKAHIHRGLYGAMVVDPDPDRVRENPEDYVPTSRPVRRGSEFHQDLVERAKRRNHEYLAEEDYGVDEMVMVMNGFDTNFDGDNEVYAANTRAFCYGVGRTDGEGNWEAGETKRPIQVDRNERQRVYLINAIEFDPINSFHTHSQFFDYYDHGTTLTPTHRTVDTVMQCQAQRGIVELDYGDHEPGLYMFHAHQSEFAELGWMSFFEVV